MHSGEPSSPVPVRSVPTNPAVRRGHRDPRQHRDVRRRTDERRERALRAASERGASVLVLEKTSADAAEETPFAPREPSAARTTGRTRRGNYSTNRTRIAGKHHRCPAFGGGLHRRHGTVHQRALRSGPDEPARLPEQRRGALARGQGHPLTVDARAPGLPVERPVGLFGGLAAGAVLGKKGLMAQQDGPARGSGGPRERRGDLRRGGDRLPPEVHIGPRRWAAVPRRGRSQADHRRQCRRPGGRRFRSRPSAA